MTLSTTQKAYMQLIDLALERWPQPALMQGAPTLTEWERRAPQMRRQVASALGLPECDLAGRRSPVAVQVRSELAGDGYSIEKLVYQSESDPDSWVPALLYKPQPAPATPAPGMIVACGHLGSKSSLSYQYTCRLFAKMGCYALMPEPIGEEERHPSGLLGSGGHREDHYLDRGSAAGRPVVGKMVYDLVRGIDLLLNRPEVDPRRIGCAGNSLGGTLTQYLAAVDPRLSLCLCAAWAADYTRLWGNKGCCWRVFGMMRTANQAELIALGAPHCATLVLCGDRDWTCPPSGTASLIEAARAVYALYGAPDRLGFHMERGGDHRPYQLAPQALRWLAEHFELNSAGAAEVLGAPERTLGEAAAISAGVQTGVTDRPSLSSAHARTVTKEIPIRIDAPSALRVLSDEERAGGPYGLEAWCTALERLLPALPRDQDDLRRWWSDRERLRESLERCLGPGIGGFAWAPAGEPVAPACVGLAQRAASRVARVFRHSLGVPGIAAYRLTPSVAASGRAVVYQTVNGTLTESHADRVEGWLAQGDAVVLLPAVRLYDNAVLLGVSETAVNVQWVRVALEGALAAGAREVRCRSEVDDVAVWAGAICPRLGAVEVGARAGRELSVIKKGRHEGVVPGFRRLTDYLGLCALVLPRPLHFDPGVLSAAEAESFAAVREEVATMLPRPDGLNDRTKGANGR